MAVSSSWETDARPAGRHALHATGLIPGGRGRLLARAEDQRPVGGNGVGVGAPKRW